MVRPDEDQEGENGKSSKILLCSQLPGENIGQHSEAGEIQGPIQPSHPLPSPSPPAFNLSQHQGLFK